MPTLLRRREALGMLAAASLRGADAPPNIVFILSDDQRRDSLGCYGNSEARTPHIDKLARDGVAFDQACVTSAICTPSRACYFLGQFERRHGVNFNSGTALSEEAWQSSYPMLLRKAGYFTGYVGKNHVPIGPRGYDGGIIESSFDFWYGAHGHLSFYPKGLRSPIFRGAKANTQAEILDEGAASFLTGPQFIDGAKTFLKERPKAKPFCLSVCFNLPHRAGTGSMRQKPDDPELYRDAYRDGIATRPLPPHYVAKADIRTPRLPANVLYAKFRQNSYDYVDTPESLREHQVRVLQTVTGIDQVVGHVREELNRLGVADNTVIVYASDHGIMEGEFGLGGKALNYDPCLRIPMIVADPRLPARMRGQRLPHLVQSIDVAPTLLDAAGLRPASTMQGRSMLPLTRGARIGWRQYAFAENLWSTVFGNPRVESARSAEWKYIRYFATDRALFDRQPASAAYGVTPEQRQAYRDWLSAPIRGLRPDHEELFDLRKDPDEAQNLAADPGHKARLDTMRRECGKLVREAKGDPDQDPATVLLAPA